MNTVVLSQAGELDIATAPRLFERLAPHRRPGCEVVLDLREVTFMDSSGLGLIVEQQQRARKSGFRFAIAVGATSDTHRILEMSGLTKVLELVDDPDAYLAGGTA